MPTYPSNYPVITQGQFVQRIIQSLPATWWASAALVPGGVTYVVLLAMAAALYFHKNNQLDYVVLQTRILTATGLNLENISNDFFGPNLPRIPGESDASYANRIIQQIEAPKATIAAIQAQVNFYFSNIYQVPFDTIYPLFGLDIVGGLSTRGGLDNPDGIVQALPSAVIWDQQSDPADAAIYDITPPHFVVDIDFPVRTGTGWFLTYSALTYESYLFDTINLSPLPDDDVDPGLKAVVDDTKAEGCIPVYMYHRSIGEGM
jgi:hypothetical protein